MKVIDAEGHVVGRLASHVGKLLCKGEEVTVVNVEKAIITGPKKRIILDFKRAREIGDRPRKGPYHPRMPDRMLRRVVRGMLPYQKPRGRAAMKKLTVYMGIPEELKNANLEVIEDAKKLPTQYITLYDLAKALGAKL